MVDGFDIKFSESCLNLSARLVVFEKKIAKQLTTKALAQTSILIRDEAIRYAPDSAAYISDMLNLPDRQRPWFITDDGQHLLKVKDKYTEISSGNLKKNIRFRKRRNSPPGTIEYQVYVKNAVAWYAKFVEFGTSKRAPQPFLRPALENNFNNLSRLLKEMIDALINEGGL